MRDVENTDARIVRAAEAVPNARLNEDRIQLMTSDFFRHDTTVFGEESLKRKEMRCLVIGLGNLQETLRLVAQYYHEKKSLEGLNMVLVDFVEQSYFQDLIAKGDVFNLGKKEGVPNVPIGLEDAFENRGGEYIANNEIQDFIKNAVNNGKFGVNVMHIRSAGFDNASFDFVSCQNVLGYVPDFLLDDTLVSIVGLGKPGGVIALKTDSKNIDIGCVLEKQKLPVQREGEQIGLYRLLSEGQTPATMGFLESDQKSGQKMVDNVSKTGNVFGI